MGEAFECVEDLLGGDSVEFAEGSGGAWGVLERPRLRVGHVWLVQAEFGLEVLVGDGGEFAPADGFGFGLELVGVLELGDVFFEGFAYVERCGPSGGCAECVEPVLQIFGKSDTHHACRHVYRMPYAVR